MADEVVGALGVEVRRVRKGLGITQKELSARSGLSQSYLAQIETGDRRAADGETVNKLCVGLGLPAGYFAEFAGGVAVTPGDVAVVSRLMLVGTVAAGPFDHPAVYDPATPVYVAGRHPAGCFALKVSGRSCTQFGICDGDTVVVRPATDGADGRFVVVKCPSGYTLKAYSRGKLLQFRPEDPEPTVIDVTEDTSIVGVVVGGEYGERGYKPAKKGRK